MKALPRSLAATSSLQKTWIESSKLPPSSSLLEARSELPSSNPSPSSFDDLCLVKISLRSPSDHTEQKWGSRPFLGASKEQVLLASRQAAKATSLVICVPVEIATRPFSLFRRKDPGSFAKRDYLTVRSSSSDSVISRSERTFAMK